MWSQVVVCLMLWTILDQTNAEDCKMTDDGRSYAGKISTTKSGLACQRWDQQDPHTHIWTNDTKIKGDFPDGSLKEASNFCRNPDDEAGPWCYTTDKNKRWESCDIPICPKTTISGYIGCRKTKKATEYRGHMAVTHSGRHCQRWDLQKPHQHSIEKNLNNTDEDTTTASNFCRNPDNETTTWCYTTDSSVRFEVCAVPYCPGFKPKKPPVLECLPEKKTDYRGTVSKTEDGRACQRWTEQLPHRHYQQTFDDEFPDGNITEAANFCRSFKMDQAPWCFTTDPNKRSENCKIDACQTDEK